MRHLCICDSWKAVDIMRLLKRKMLTNNTEKNKLYFVEKNRVCEKKKFDMWLEKQSKYAEEDENSVGNLINQ
jgi:hypothetical protein